MYDYTQAEAEVVLEPHTELAADAQEKAERLARDPSTPGERDLENWQVRDDQLSYNAAVKMNLPIADVSGEFSRRVILRDTCRYTEVRSGTTVTTWGVAVRLTVTVWAAKLEGQLTLPMVAAQAQLGMVKASADLRVLGFRSNAVGKLLPRFQTLDVGSYSEYTKASDEVSSFISEHPEDVVPVILKTFEPPAEGSGLLEAVGAARALRFLARRRSMRQAVEDLNAWPELAEAVKATYGEMSPESGLDDKPSSGAADRAAQWVSWLE